MKTPATEIDTRFSQPDAIATEWDETRRVLESAELFWISTVRSDGRPHLTPAVAVWLEDALYFSTGEGEQKMLNIRGNPNVLLLTGCNGWESGLDVAVEGRAVPVTDEAMLTRLNEAWGTKWDGRWQWEVRDNSFQGGHGAAFVFSVVPTKVLAFAKGTFGHTRHVF